MIDKKRKIKKTKKRNTKLKIKFSSYFWNIIFLDKNKFDINVKIVEIFL